MRRVFIGFKGWQAQDHLLDRMTLADLFRAYFTYPAIQISIVLSLLSLAAAVYFADSLLLLLLIVVLAPLVYSLVEYVLHRYVLHGRFLYRSKATAAIWKRVHYDHHQDPANLAVLFGDMRTTLPPILLIAIPPGYLIHGIGGAAMAVCCGVLLVALYEFCHAAQHLPYEPASRYLRRLKKRHLAHHFHNETGNFGITTPFWDRRFGTNYDRTSERPRSATVRNLGYAGEEAARYPWVQQLTAEDARAGQ